MTADRFERQGKTNLYYEEIYNSLSKDFYVAARTVPPMSWAEIDTVHDVPDAAAITPRSDASTGTVRAISCSHASRSRRCAPAIAVKRTADPWKSASKQS